MDLHALLTETARDHGIPVSGSIDLAKAFADPSLPAHIQHYDEWLSAGYGAQMEYLRRGRDRRANPRELFPEAQSVFSIAIPYAASACGAESAQVGPRYARYLQGSDYHETMSVLLESVLKKVSALWNAENPDSPLRWKVCVDSSAVLERTWASLAGLGWIGKNTLLIHPKYGSFLLLGEVLLNQETGHGPAPIADYCGSCTRCLKSCPTGAFPKPHTLNSNQCISYWTLEKRGTLEIPSNLKEKIGPWVAGCDLCQEACPFNWKVMRQASANTKAQHSALLQHWKELLRETAPEYRVRVKNSALNRIKDYQFSRNLAITLAHAFSEMPSEVLRDLEPEIQKRVSEETHEAAKAEWIRCLSLMPAQSSAHK